MNLRRKARPPMKERSRIRVGVIGTLLVVALLAVIFNYKSIPGVRSVTDFKAEFSDASGLTTKDDIQIAGMVVGRVQSIELVGDRVVVAFDADLGDVSLGDKTTAVIKVATVLGKRYIELRPAGSGSLPEDSTIPLDRTTSGYDVTQSLAEVTDTLAKTDKEQLSTALETTSGLLRDVSPQLETSLTGLTRLSQTVSSRDEAIGELLAHTNGVSDILAQRNQQFTLLMTDGQSLFKALNDRSDSIHRVIVQAKSVFDELNAIATDNRTELAATLDQLAGTLTLLNNNYDNVNASIGGLTTFVTQLSDVVASGPFFNVLLHNITPANLNGQQPDSLGAPR